jgi:hypothetical protein
VSDAGLARDSAHAFRAGRGADRRGDVTCVAGLEGVGEKTSIASSVLSIVAGPKSVSFSAIVFAPVATG